MRAVYHSQILMEALEKIQVQGTSWEILQNEKEMSSYLHLAQEHLLY